MTKPLPQLRFQKRIRDTVSEIVEDLEVHKDSENARSTPEEEEP
jgi:hypothetical protein